MTQCCQCLVELAPRPLKSLGCDFLLPRPDVEALAPGKKACIGKRDQDIVNYFYVPCYCAINFKDTLVALGARHQLLSHYSNLDARFIHAFLVKENVAAMVIHRLTYISHRVLGHKGKLGKFRPENGKHRAKLGRFGAKMGKIILGVKCLGASCSGAKCMSNPSPPPCIFGYRRCWKPSRCGFGASQRHRVDRILGLQ